MAGEAPAPQLNDRSRPRPQRGNGRERLPPLAAHRHMRPLHVLEPCRAAEAGARVQASIEGFKPIFSTCSDARSLYVDELLQEVGRECIERRVDLR